MTVASPGGPVRWERLHPLSPIVRGGRLAGALLVVLLIGSAQGRSGTGARLGIDLVLIVLVGVIGAVQWLVTRWAFDGVTLRYETGVLRRDARQVPVARIQAVDLVQPLFARFVGVSEVKITLAGGGRTTRLAYLSDSRAAGLRAALLAAHHGQHPATPAPVEVASLSVPTGRLVGSVVLSAPSFVMLLLVAAVLSVATASPAALPGVFAVLFTYLVGVGTGIWRRFNVLYGFTVAQSADGIRIRRGLLGTVSETIPVRRIQAVRQVEPLLWRSMGWCRLEVVLARVPGRDSGQGSGQVRKTLLPVGSRRAAETLRAMAIGTVGLTPTRPPRRARLKAPLSYHFLAAGHDGTMAWAVTGRVCRRSCWVPLEKVQSVRRVQGPLQRRLGLATVHVDVAGRAVAAEFRDRDTGEADGLVDDVAALSRLSRTRAAPEPQPAATPSPVTAAYPAAATGPVPPPGWYEDPAGRHHRRYWDGARWTAHVHDEGRSTALDPLSG